MLKQLDRRSVLFLGVVGGVFLIIFLIYFIFGRNAALSFEAIEKRMEKAAASYIAKNTEQYSMDTDREFTITALELQNGYMKSLEKMTKKDVSCFGEVRVVIQDEEAAYFPYLDCGMDYKTTSLFERITETQDVITQGAGLYNYGDSYVFRGEEVDNYLEFSGRLWQILSIDGDKNVKLIQLNPFHKMVWDNKYNVEKDNRVGINVYEDTIRESSDIFNELSTYIENKDFLSSTEIAKLVKMNLCIGPRSGEETSKNGNIECSIKTTPQYVGLISAYEYLRTSLDEDCIQTDSPACSNYNFLHKLENGWWTLTPHTDETDIVWGVESALTRRKVSRILLPRTVITLNANIISSEGIGTRDLPYVVR